MTSDAPDTAPPVTSTASLPVPGQTLVWDASPLYHAIEAGKVDLLGDLSRRHGGVPRRNVTTATVLEEIAYHRLPAAGLDWLEEVHVDGLRELGALITWAERVGEKSNQGEATVLAWAEVHGATAVIDDGDARRLGRGAGLEVWGSLRVIAEAVREGHQTAYAATALVDSLIDTGARYPCPRGGFFTWAKTHGLLS